MYKIHVARDGTCVCEVRIQDGVERFPAPNRQKAIYKTISAARVLNHDYIKEEDIQFNDVPLPPKECPACEEWKVTRNRLSNGEVQMIETCDPRLAYKITAAECDLILDIREGRATVIKEVPEEAAHVVIAPGEVVLDDPILGRVIINAHDPRLAGMEQYIVAKGGDIAQAHATRTDRLVAPDRKFVLETGNFGFVPDITENNDGRPCL